MVELRARAGAQRDGRPVHGDDDLSEAAVTVERVAAEHVSELLPLMRGYLDFYEASPPDEDVSALVEALLADPGQGVQLLARDRAGTAVGFATVYWTWSTTRARRIGRMNDLFVAEAARGTGAADALIEACALACREHGAGVLEWMTAPDNTRAQVVYNRVGGVPSQWISYEREVAR